jgi:uncharacterized protein YndB with AHSA1/START domain
MTKRRAIELEVEVPGTPEEVWDAIATGPGLAAWFAPAEISGQPGGPVSFDMGGGMEQTGVVTAFDPPERFAYEEEWDALEGRPAAKLATEWLVEAGAGGTCVVRLVSSVFEREDEWDDELQQMREGWLVHMNLLRLYLTHFGGDPVAWIQTTGTSSGSAGAAWEALTGALGLPAAALGERAAASANGAPTLAGVVEQRVDSAHHRGVMLRLGEPGPGVGLVFVYTWHEQVHTNVHLYFYGQEAGALAEREEPTWSAWMEERFPAPAPA